MDSAVNPANNPTDAIPEAKQPSPAGSSNNANVTKRQVDSKCRAPRPSRSESASADHPNTRLQTELMTLMMSPSPGISAFPNETNFLEWTATIEGPEGTPYAGLSLKLSFAFPSNYPYSPPTVLFKTPIYHPNIDFSGRICLDILKEKWSAIYNVQTVLLSLQSLLGEPNNASPLNGQAAELWDTDFEEYKRLVLARHRDLSDEELAA